ncbi:MAG: cation transporter [Candidatus Omnitrophica bacterium]|nr:cation transporter [Candidatus Omnitrophota bacterium]
MNSHASHEKNKAAGSSVIAALGLTGMKIVVGVMTGSLGIIAEAAHSGLDLVAAVITAFAVKKSAEPADREHPYGHGKFENLSAFVETLLLLFTAGWIIMTAIKHIIAGKVEIEVTFWSFAVMIVSIIVDISRSRMLYRVAKKYNSQALEADALHFSTDIWSSAVVVFGLFCVLLSDWVKGWDFLHYADSVAALIIAIIVIQVSMKLGKQTIDSLLDVAPKGLDLKIKTTVEALPYVKNCHKIRIRSLGHQYFIELHVVMDGSIALREAHALTEEIEKVIEGILPDADVTVHPEAN